MLETERYFGCVQYTAMLVEKVERARKGAFTPFNQMLAMSSVIWSRDSAIVVEDDVQTWPPVSMWVTALMRNGLPAW